MKFQTLKEEFLHHCRARNKLQQVLDREWLLPDYEKNGALVIRITMLDEVYPLGGDAGEHEPIIHIEHMRWSPEPEASYTIKNGPKLERGYFTQEYRGLSEANKDVLAYVIAARTYAEKWIDGEIDSLPAQPFV